MEEKKWFLYKPREENKEADKMANEALDKGDFEEFNKEGMQELERVLPEEEDAALQINSDGACRKKTPPESSYGIYAQIKTRRGKWEIYRKGQRTEAKDNFISEWEGAEDAVETYIRIIRNMYDV